MHICFITNEYPKADYPHGGVGTFIKTITKPFILKGHKVSIVGINVYTKGNDFEKDGKVNIYRLKPKTFKGLTWHFNYQSINKKIKEIHQSDPIDIVESAELGLAFIKKIKGIKYIIRLHGGHHFFAEAEERSINKWKGIQEKRSFKNADGFIAMSEYVKNHTQNYLSYHNKPVEVIRCPINLEVFKPMPSIVQESNTILFAGTVCEKKGIRQLLLAMPEVIEAVPDARLHIYGRDWFFPDGSSYISFLKEKTLPKLGNVSQYINFMGPIPFTELAKKYAAAQVCVFPSLMETQGLVAPEAMAMEKTVIFSKHGPGSETIAHEKTGLLCDPYVPKNISEHIIWCLNNKAEAINMGKKARAFVLETFNIETITIKNLNFYKAL